MIDLKNKNIIFLVHSYRTFQKDQIDSIFKYFKNVYVIVRYKPISSLSKFVKISGLNVHTKDYAIDLQNKPNNVHIYEAPMWYLPINFIYRSIGRYHFNVIDNIIKKNNIYFDIIHSHFLWTSGYAGAILKKKYNKPLVVTGHGYDVYDLPFRDKVWMDNILYSLKNANVITTVSHKNKDILEKIGINNKIHIIPNGYDDKIFYPRNKEYCRSQLNLPLDKKIILSVGNLEKVKGHVNLINALPNILKYHENVLCYIVGEGSQRNYLKSTIDKLELNNKIFLIGKRPHDEISLWMNACDLFVLPSLNEGNPTVMFECLACGIPFVGSDVGGISEYIKSDELGMLSKAEDHVALSENIAKCLNNNYDSNIISSSVKNCTWDAVSELYLDRYREIIER